MQSPCGPTVSIHQPRPVLDSPRSHNTPISRRSDAGVPTSQLYRVPNPATNTLIGPCIVCYKEDCPHSAPIRHAKLDMMVKRRDVHHNKPGEMKMNAKIGTRGIRTANRTLATPVFETYPVVCSVLRIMVVPKQQRQGRLLLQEGSPTPGIQREIGRCSPSR